MGRVWSEEHKYQTWLEIELAVCEVLAHKKKIPSWAWQAIRERARFDIHQIQAVEAKVKHDVIAFLTVVNQFVGPASRYIHQGMTSSDLLDTALALQLCRAADLIGKKLTRLEIILKQLARRHARTVTIGRTHGVHAEPITFGWKMAVWRQEVKRHQIRLRRAREVIAVGKISGPVGTYTNIEPWVEAAVCRQLRLKPEPVANQIVQRERHAEWMTTLALIAASLEKFAVEIRHLQRSEVLEAEEPFTEGQKGSSAMPHKRNPIACERVTGLARIVRANAMASLENVALWHERDISHSSVERIALPDSCIAVDYMLQVMNDVLQDLRVYPKRMKQNIDATRGLVFSQRVLITLTKKGLSREQAYEVVQKNAMRCWENGKSFQTHLAGDPLVKRTMSSKELQACFRLEPYFKHIPNVLRRLGI